MSEECEKYEIDASETSEESKWGPDDSTADVKFEIGKVYFPCDVNGYYMRVVDRVVDKDGDLAVLCLRSPRPEVDEAHSQKGRFYIWFQVAPNGAVVETIYGSDGLEFDPRRPAGYLDAAEDEGKEDFEW